VICRPNYRDLELVRVLSFFSSPEGEEEKFRELDYFVRHNCFTVN
jgi:hypothetical protein